MGGPGSGNYFSHWWRPTKKTVVEDCLSLDANRWTREGILRAGIQRSGTWQWKYSDGHTSWIEYEVRTLDMGWPTVRLAYGWPNKETGQRETADYRVDLTTTRPRFGGLRFWFVCPLVVGGRPCGRRAGKLYLPPWGRYFGCRRCYDLSYTSAQESRKYDGLWRRLAADTGMDPRLVKRAMGRIGKRYF
jgi:hypothetical protein